MSQPNNVSAAGVLSDEQRAAIKYARRVMGSVSWETPDSIHAKQVIDTLLVAASAQATGWGVQEPVAWLYRVWDVIHLEQQQLDHYYSTDKGKTYVKGVPLYAAPSPATSSAGGGMTLTDEQREAVEWAARLASGASGYVRPLDGESLMLRRQRVLSALLREAGSR